MAAMTEKLDVWVLDGWDDGKQESITKVFCDPEDAERARAKYDGRDDVYIGVVERRVLGKPRV